MVSKPKSEFKTNKKNTNLHSVVFNDLTKGEVLALIHALMLARTVSPVAQDLSDFLRNALYQAVQNGEGSKTQELMIALEGDLDLMVVNKN